MSYSYKLFLMTTPLSAIQAWVRGKLTAVSNYSDHITIINTYGDGEESLATVNSDVATYGITEAPTLVKINADSSFEKIVIDPCCMTQAYWEYLIANKLEGEGSDSDVVPLSQIDDATARAAHGGSSGFIYNGVDYFPVS